MINYSISNFIQIMQVMFLDPIKLMFGYLNNIKIGSTTWLAIIITFIVSMLVILSIVRPSGLSALNSGISVVRSAKSVSRDRRSRGTVKGRSHD